MARIGRFVTRRAAIGLELDGGRTFLECRVEVIGEHFHAAILCWRGRGRAFLEQDRTAFLQIGVIAGRCFARDILRRRRMCCPFGRSGLRGRR
jgi:hypothetical protein